MSHSRLIPPILPAILMSALPQRASQVGRRVSRGLAYDYAPSILPDRRANEGGDRSLRPLYQQGRQLVWRRYHVNRP
jgi:hypothetical protein